MKWFKDPKVTTIFLAFVVVLCAFAAFIGYLGVNDATTAKGRFDSLYTDGMMGVSHIRDANTYMVAYRGGIRNLILTTSHEERTKQMKELAIFQLNLLAEMNEAIPTVTSETGRRLVAEFWPAWQNYKRIADNIVALSATRKTEALDLSNTTGRQAADAVSIIISRMAMAREAAGWDAYLQAESFYHRSKSLLMWAVIGFMVFAIAFALSLGRLISQTIAGTEGSDSRELDQAPENSLEPQHL